MSEDSDHIKSTSLAQGSIAMLAEIESGELLQKQLHNAFDVAKIFPVFETFLKIIKEQQQEIANVSKNVEALNEQARKTDLRMKETEEKLKLADAKISELFEESKTETISQISSLRDEVSGTIAGVKNFCIELTAKDKSEEEHVPLEHAPHMVVVDEEVEKQKLLELQEIKKDISELRKDLVTATEAAAMPHVITNQIIVDDTASTIEIEKIHKNIQMIDENFKTFQPKFELFLTELNKDRVRVDGILTEVIDNRQKIERNQEHVNKNLQNILTEVNKDRIRIASVEEVLSDKGEMMKPDASANSLIMPSSSSSSSASSSSSLSASTSTVPISLEQIRSSVTEILSEFNISKPLINLHLLEDIEGLIAMSGSLKPSTSSSSSFGNNANDAPSNPSSPKRAEKEEEKEVEVSPLALLEQMETLAALQLQQQQQSPSLKKKRTKMDVDRLLLLSAHKRRELMGWLKVKGKKILKEKEKKRRERDQLMSVPEKLKDLESIQMEMSSKLEKQDKVIRNLDRMILDKIRTSLPDNFSTKFTSLASMLMKIDELGGVDQLFTRIKLLQGEVQGVNRFMKEMQREAMEDMKIFTSDKKLLSEPFLRLVRQQIGPCEPNSDSNTIIDIINRIHKVNEEAVRFVELDEIFEYQRGDTKIVNRRYEKLKETVENVCQGMLTEYTQQAMGLQVKIDPKEFKQLLKEAESYTNAQVSNISSQIFQTYDEKLQKLEETKLQSLNDQIKRLEYEQFQIKDKFDMVGKTYSTMGGGSKTIGGGMANQEIEKAIKSHVQAFAEDVRYQKEKDKEVFRQMSDQVIQLQQQLEKRPDKDNVKEMIGFLESAFKRRFGGDMSSLRTTITQIVKAVQEKAGREEVATMIADKVENLENQMSGTLMEDNSKISIATKCISCGQPSMYRTRTPGAGLLGHNNNNNNNSVRAHSPFENSDDNSSVHSKLSAASGHLSLSSVNSSIGGGGGDMSSLSTGGQSTAAAAQFIKNFYDIAGGKVGLKSLLNHSPPFDPRPNPLPRSPDSSSSSLGGSKKSPFKGSPNSYSTDQGSIPLYQKARISNHMKELVKQPTMIPTSQSTQNLYMLDNSNNGGGLRRNVNSTNSNNRDQYDDDVSIGSQRSSHSLPQLHRSPTKKLGI